jgi:hypothetical protein
MRTPMTVGALLALGAASTRAQGWDTRLTSVDEYLYEESYEIVLARNAAPDHIAAEATVLVHRAGWIQRALCGLERVHLSRGAFLEQPYRSPY